MNKTEFYSELSSIIGCSEEKISALSNSLIVHMVNELDNGSRLEIENFGNFEVIKNDMYIVDDKKLMEKKLYPPKLEICFTSENDHSDNLE